MNNSNSGFELLIGRIIAFQALFSHSIWFAVSLEKKNKKRKLHWKLKGFPSRAPVLALKAKPTTPRGFVAPGGAFLSFQRLGSCRWLWAHGYSRDQHVARMFTRSHLSFCSFTLWHGIGGQWKYSFLSKNRVPVWEQVRFALCGNIAGFLCASPHITPF